MLAVRRHRGYPHCMPLSSPSGSKVQMITAAVATASIGGLVGMTVTGILTSLPVWAAVMLVVGELAAPLIVYVVLKRQEERR